MFEMMEHTSDVGIRVRANRWEDLFVDAAKGLFAVLLAKPEEIDPVQQVDLIIPGQEDDELLLDWLRELLYIFATRRLVFCEFEVRRTTEGIAARALGEPLDQHRHQPQIEVKAITYHGLKVERTEDGWLAEVIVDI